MNLDRMNRICEKDCETKEYFKNNALIEAAVVCLSCIHSKRVNNYVPRKNVSELTIFNRIKRNVTNYFIRNSRY